jgi:ubiquitin C-terminal hydrolase
MFKYIIITISIIIQNMSIEIYKDSNYKDSNYKETNYKDRGLSGLANLGNTCFLNSCMQVLSHTYELNDFFNKNTYQKKLNNKYESALIVEWDNLRKLLWSQNCTVAPKKFLKTVQVIAEKKGLEMFTGYAQNDLPEFLLFVIDCFHTGLSRQITMKINGNTENETDKIAMKCYEMIKNMYSKEYSEIWNLFYAVQVSVIVSLESGKQQSITPEPYFMVDLPIPQNNKSPNLYDCFDLFVEGETLEGDNAWFNSEIQRKENVMKKISFWSFPNILIIDFKRFNARNQKNQILIDFPLDNLDLTKYVIGYKKNSYKYELFGVCNHGGSALGGHYTSYIKNANGKWYHFNDTSVQEVPIVKSIISTKAYCLFYRKKTIL